MATDKTEETDENTDEESRANAKSLIREVVDEALEGFAKKHKPAPRRTESSNDGASKVSPWDFLFGKSG